MVDWEQGAFLAFFYPGGFGKLVGFWAACCQAVYSYLGVELIGIAAEETERPLQTLPRAVRRVSYRIIIYYVGAVFVLGLNVSARDPFLQYDVSNGAYPPFVLMVQRAGIPVLPHIINGIGLLAALTVANASIYVSVISCSESPR
jgi:yeast amino acid transporter